MARLMPALTLAAAAKLNLGLGVLRRRDDGFHDIDSVMVRIDLADRIVLSPLGDPRVEGVALPSSDRWVGSAAPPMDGTNLAVRAANCYLGAAGWPGGVQLGLAKEIPVAAGLGGGSSDAAATLRGLAQLYPADVDLPELAAELGSDVPFFISGLVAARARGRGERLEALPPIRGGALLLNPGVGVSAGRAYGWLEQPRGALGAERTPSSLPDPSELRNDLQPGVVQRVPEVAAALAALEALAIGPVAMSGSGATCYAMATDAHALARGAAVLGRQHPNWWVRPVRFAC
jgi:4-diphosphocytidyl-2-C-methyl-D-erythritol kinase